MKELTACAISEPSPILPSQMASLGQNFKRLRKAHGLTQVYFAKRLGVPQSTVSRWENDKYAMPDTKNILRIAKALDVPLDVLLFGVDADYDQLRHASTEPSVLREGDRVEGFDPREGYQPDDLPVIAEGEGTPRPEIFWDSAGRLLNTVTDRISRPTGVTDRRAYAVKVRGDSMVPAIRPGHFLVVSPAAPIADGDEVFVVMKSGEHLIKFARKVDSGWLLESANQLHESRIVKKSEIESIHAVVWIRRKTAGMRTIDLDTGRRLEKPDEDYTDDDLRRDFAKLSATDQDKVRNFLKQFRAEKAKRLRAGGQLKKRRSS